MFIKSKHLRTRTEWIEGSWEWNRKSFGIVVIQYIISMKTMQFCRAPISKLRKHLMMISPIMRRDSHFAGLLSVSLIGADFPSGRHAVIFPFDK